ncbi:MAG: hypothetical protein HQM02_13830 [Magnetococcales bacterium]|nr:hypothetical protein [Magnetococcales bacterium]
MNPVTTPGMRKPTSRRSAPLLAAALTALLLPAGCSSMPEPYPLISVPLTATPDVEPAEVAHQAADAMIADLKDKLDHRSVILPASFVDESNLEKTSPLGRLLARQMASRFTQAGHSLVEIALRKEILLKKGSGQFVLSQEVKEIRKTHKVSAVLAGSYVTARNRIYVNAQLIRTQDGVVLASNDFSLPLTTNVRVLLK